MNISDDLFFNIVKDWEKKDIPREQKSVLLKQYLKEKNISQRKLAKQLGISHSTLYDWISLRQVQKYYNKKNELITLDNNTIYSLADRLIFLLSKTDNLTDKEFHKLKLLVSEIDKKDVISLEG